MVTRYKNIKLFVIIYLYLQNNKKPSYGTKTPYIGWIEAILWLGYTSWCLLYNKTKTMIDENIKNHLNNIINTEKKETESYFSFLRHLATISIGFLGLLIGLKPETLPNQNSKVFFLVTITLIAFGILFLSICLFYETKKYREEIKVRQKQLNEYLDSDKKEDVQISHLDPGNLKIFEITTFILLILSIFSLILYVYYSII
ncbi:hypothetical protein ACM55M_05685 [Flavobacterium sp. ZT3R25]|uniref:hypothetical protein n=1 Tax=Flavobacterium galactosi TaxID=3398735 RepID=UPI003A8B1B05